MITEKYETFSFRDEPKWEEVPEGKLMFSHWSSEAEYDTRFKMCFVKEKGIYLRMYTDEKNLRAVGVKRDDPVYEDSCMEFFICAVEGREEYINFEMNPNGAFLSEFGKNKKDRVFLKTLTDIEPVIHTKITDEGWSAELFIPCELIAEAYGEVFDADECLLKGNFYKCGDKTYKIHYLSYNEMSTLPPGFHNPERFACIAVKRKDK